MVHTPEGMEVTSDTKKGEMCHRGEVGGERGSGQTSNIFAVNK